MTARTDRLIWISAGEASGDMHGALLAKSLKALDPDLRLAGMGGPAMGEAGCELVFSMDLVSMMGGTEVVSGLPRIIRLLSETRKAFGRLKPDAVVVIDCPEVNFRVARSAHGLGIPVHYYVCPQIWAWRKGRVRLLKRYFRKVLCILPFEKDFYAQRGVAAEYVGNPLLDQLPLAELESVAPEPDRVAVLPGSRKKEVRALLPDFAAAARIIALSRPRARFSLIRAPGLDRGLLEGLWPRDLAVEIIEPEGRYRAMKRSRAALAASGTVALECALLGLPAVVAYRLSPLTFFLARLAVRIPFVSLPNLILNQEAFPELLQDEARPENIAAKALVWLEQAEAAEAVRRDLDRLRRMVGEPGAADRAAKAILQDLSARGPGRT